jgi:hypothetical protein
MTLTPAGTHWRIFGQHELRWLFGATLLLRLLYPFFSSPLDRLFSDPARHWDNALHFLHPSVMGSGDPYLYQVWLFGLQQLARQSVPGVLLGCGVLCAVMPYGWYRALRELLPRPWALGGGVLIALVPSFLGIYAYFMNETLLLSLTGLAFWLTLRARRKATVRAFVAACVLWLAVCFTRSVLIPIALMCLLWIALLPPRRWLKLLWGLALFTAIAIPAGLHCRAALGFFSPFGNPYMAEIYRHSGKKLIALNYLSQGRYGFGSPSFYNPTFYPFSDWLTDRVGEVAVVIDTTRGRASWIEEDRRVRGERTFSTIQDYWENLLYLGFGQPWPANDHNTLVGALTIWARWLWPPIAIAVALGVVGRRFVEREWLLPICGLSMLALLAVQNGGIIEGRYRLPVDPIVLAALVVLCYRVYARRRSFRASSKQPVRDEILTAVQRRVTGSCVG